MASWCWVEVNVDADRQVVQSESVFATRDEAVAALQRFLDKYSDQEEPVAAGAEQLREGPAQDGVVGGLGTYWVLGRAPVERTLVLADREGRARTVVVRIEPTVRGNTSTGPADPVHGAGVGRINRRDLPLGMRIEGLAIGLCFALGMLFTIGGIRSWLDPSRWETGRILLLPAAAVVVGAYYWGKNFRVRAYARPDR